MNELKKYTKNDFAAIRERFTALGISEASFNKEVSFGLQIIGKSKLLQQCQPESILQAVLNIAQVGLTLNPVSKEAYLIPRWDNHIKGYVCYLEPDYRGLMRLATDSGAVMKITTNLVYDGDSFDVEYTPEIEIKHRPYFANGNAKGHVKGCYSYAVLHDGNKQFEYMDIAELEMIRGRSESWKAYEAGKISTCIWLSDFSEMCRKTVIKRLFKYLPRTTQNDRLNKAVELDNEQYKASNRQIEYIENLLLSTSYDVDKVVEIEKMLPGLLSHQAEIIIKELNENQIDPVDSGSGYTQTDILKKLDKLEKQ